MRERNSPRNSQLETHRIDEAEGGPGEDRPGVLLEELFGR
jgi:hypothetical protein